MPNANATCSGTAGVNGPDQNTIIALKAVQYQGLINIANAAHTAQGDQNMTSAIIKQIKNDLRVIFCRSQCPSRLKIDLILFNMICLLLHHHH